ncbi:hypothetical protein SAMN05216483_6793 [Streptomyces sp. 2131.1]|uniref:hypothetical protein n=1 Tax=Streptomyces sp. 2131.1 TaxID=1855346 RepID=UPI00089AF4E9|nr:hypothetical protein [Streptomyces sp. 2131.1]SEE85211.1 hypothetical protein SAMN05216483_6793 [Streptomyces sp. 2131.1]
MSRTAAEAAQEAVEWAERAEIAFSMASIRRAEGAAVAERRGPHSESAAWYQKAEDSERERGTAAAMASMWADVAGALHLVEEGEPK